MLKRTTPFVLVGLAVSTGYLYSMYLASLRPQTHADGRYIVVDLGPGMQTFVEYMTLNAHGQTTGSYHVTHTGAQHAFRTSAGQAPDSSADLGTLGGFNSVGRAINDRGQVTGLSGITSTISHAFRTSPTGKISDSGTDLGTLGGTYSQGWAINASGQVTGESSLSGTWHRHAFRTSATGKISDPGTDLGTLGGDGSIGRSLNSKGQVVGQSKLSGGDTIHAFLYTDGLGMQDLNRLLSPEDQKRWILEDACLIRDNGEIMGLGIFEGELHAYRLRPISAAAKP